MPDNAGGRWTNHCYVMFFFVFYSISVILHVYSLEQPCSAMYMWKQQTFPVLALIIIQKLDISVKHVNVVCVFNFFSVGGGKTTCTKSRFVLLASLSGLSSRFTDDFIFTKGRTLVLFWPRFIYSTNDSPRIIEILL